MTEPAPRARKPRSARIATHEPEEQQGRGPVVEHNGQRRGFTLDLPMLSLNVHRPNVSRQQVGSVVGTVAGTARSVLRPDHFLYYSGLAALAAFEVIEWPVAAAIGAGLIVAERSRRRRGEVPEQRPSSPRRGAEPATASA
ncbi:hypothetical protein Misp01_38810 [Microtetraspora sp. NBRC 13810]|uniref:hypothetical protein n=1 Tax=Microtetraspora sp. NBRC 13810 TaxID=3030990 RepID=UPI0025549CE2|nr:hypothetical protein [Microtetraspora sp. NBRC 13810]GLW08751.1 hypothetical protein Misp01_38810 [Microtetraspora sp. NBRC 13810]